MGCLQVEIDLSKIRFNSQSLVNTLAPQGVSVSGVTKGVCGHPAVAKAMLSGGIQQLADARISNIRRMRAAGIQCPITMMRGPLVAQTLEVVRHCNISFNTDFNTIKRLVEATTELNQTHHIMLMVELGDARDGLLPEALPAMIQHIKSIPRISLLGLATNFACLSGVGPTQQSMEQFSSLIAAAESSWGSPLKMHSGGGSANLPLACAATSSEKSNNLRLGEAILLGTEPVSGQPIPGLHTDAIRLMAEVIESTPTGAVLHSRKQASGACVRLVIALGSQDTDIQGLNFPNGVTLVGATSDHLVVHSTSFKYPVGTHLPIQLNYTALARAMSSTDVGTRVFNS